MTIRSFAAIFYFRASIIKVQCPSSSAAMLKVFSESLATDNYIEMRTRNMQANIEMLTIRIEEYELPYHFLLNVNHFSIFD